MADAPRHVNGLLSDPVSMRINTNIMASVDSLRKDEMILSNGGSCKRGSDPLALMRRDTSVPVTDAKDVLRMRELGDPPGSRRRAWKLMKGGSREREPKKPQRPNGHQPK